MAYKFSETGKLGDEFQRVFGIGFKPFYDRLMSFASKQLCIDILKFDEWLHERHGNYEDAGQSMDDCIREHYGDEGVKLINGVTGADGDDVPFEPEQGKPKRKPKAKAKAKANANERIAMALLMQCAIVWEHCTKLDRKVTSCELEFADVWNGMGDYKMWKKCPIGQIEVDVDKCEHLDVLIRRMKATDGVEDFRYDGCWTMVKLFVQTDDRDPSIGFRCGYPLGGVFGVTRNFCMMNACQSLLNKTVFGMDGNGKWARLPEVKTDGKAKPKAKPKAAKEAVQHQPSSIGHQPSDIGHQPSFAERLREALLKHYRAAA